MFVVYARTGPGFGGACFGPASPRDSSSVPTEKMGLRTSPMSQVYLDDCRLPGLRPW
ncbi:MAG: hypothetical protein MZW92_28010 [Comamonadaceae bacterium]|nr:hypothetical protein [Comamonadaceae bacterium]